MAKLPQSTALIPFDVQQTFLDCVSTSACMAGNLGFSTFVVCNATAAFARYALDGTLRSAEAMHSAALSDLHEEFATVLDTAEILQNARA